MKAVETGTAKRGRKVVGVAFLSLAMSLGLAACGAEEEASSEEVGLENETYEYGDYNDDWDLDGSGDLDENEYYDGAYTSWDSDGDGVVNEEEYNAGIDGYYTDYSEEEYGAFDDWDSDGDGEISDTEFDDSVSDDGLFDDWDSDDDDAITEDEFDQQTATSPAARENTTES